MSLRATEFSEDATKAIATEVAGLAARPEQRERYLGGAPVEKLKLAAPHLVYTLGLKDLAGNPGIDEAKPIGHRCLIMSNDDAVATAEIADPEGAEGVTTTRGPFTEATVATIDEVEGWDEVRERDYELRLLRIPALYVMALWLHDGDGGEDLFSPLAPVPEGLDEHKRYTWAELTDILRPQAARLLDAPEGLA
ncbi:MAG TPA: hypothetical protein VFI03_06430 [Solirubrobacterales bacterium]|nr:hypothetical protein [Solirubrobacterales bacterium]